MYLVTERLQVWRRTVALRSQPLLRASIEIKDIFLREFEVVNMLTFHVEIPVSVLCRGEFIYLPPVHHDFEVGV